MKGKVALVVGFSAGYVLGARAGRSRYNQIKKIADKVWNTPVVQSGVGQVSDFAAERYDEARSLVGAKVGEVIAKPRRNKSTAS